MMSSPSPHWSIDVRQAEWLTERLDDLAAGTVSSIVPAGFNAYARIFHPMRATAKRERPVRWKDVTEWSGEVLNAQSLWLTVAMPEATPVHLLPGRTGGHCAVRCTPTTRESSPRLLGASPMPRSSAGAVSGTDLVGCRETGSCRWATRQTLLLRAQSHSKGTSGPKFVLGTATTSCTRSSLMGRSWPQSTLSKATRRICGGRQTACGAWGLTSTLIQPTSEDRGPSLMPSSRVKNLRRWN